MPKWLTQIVLPLASGVLLLLGVVGVGSLLRGYFHDTRRATIRFSDIDCVTSLNCKPPEQLTREEFLAEVQYMANWPDELNLLEAGLPARLHLSFAAHPWVERVDRVQIISQQQVRVLLVYRTPVLTVAGHGRVVDRYGVLLPLAAADPRLPVLHGVNAPPSGRTGQLWGDDTVTGVATVAGLLALYQEQLRLTRFDIKGGDLFLSGEGHRVIWGPPAEAAPEAKVALLLKLVAERGDRDGPVIDLRTPPAP